MSARADNPSPAALVALLLLAAILIDALATCTRAFP
jgi:hypothetical protein